MQRGLWIVADEFEEGRGEKAKGAAPAGAARKGWGTGEGGGSRGDHAEVCMQRPVGNEPCRGGGIRDRNTEGRC